MKKIFLIVALLFMYAGTVSAQNVLYEDNLDSYPNNSYMGQNLPAWWAVWGAYATGLDLQIKTTQSHSSPNSAVADKVGGVCDAILKLGNKVSGAYELKWWMYIPVQKCAYYNIQHMEDPGIEWAFEIYFRTGGTTTGKMILQVNDDTTMYNYPKATWFEVKHQIDLDKDSIWLWVNNQFIMKWQFSFQASDPPGTKQLGGVDFYAGAYGSTTEQPLFYIDDVSFIETTVATVPIISATPDSVSQAVLLGSTGTSDLLVNNTGTADLTFNVNVMYDIPAKKSAPVITGKSATPEVKRMLTKATATPTNGGAPNATDATAILHYDGDNASAIGWNTVPTNVTVAARFPNALTLPYAGLDIVSMDVFINDLNNPPASNLMKVIIFGMGNTYKPGDTLYQQEFTPADTGWMNIALTTPVKVNGEDLWVGYNLTQITADIFIPGVDGGPADPNGDFSSTGVGWGHLAPTLDYNWNIRANLSGDLYTQWLTVTPMSGMVGIDTSATLTLGFSTTGLAYGQYHAMIKFLSNDPATPVYDVPVTLDVMGVGMNEHNKTGVMVYPNPVQDKLNIASNGTILSVTITDVNGKVVFNGNSKSVDISGLSNGIYVVTVVTAQGTSNTKFVKN